MHVLADSHGMQPNMYEVTKKSMLFEQQTLLCSPALRHQSVLYYDHRHVYHAVLYHAGQTVPVCIIQKLALSIWHNKAQPEQCCRRVKHKAPAIVIFHHSLFLEGSAYAQATWKSRGTR